MPKLVLESGKEIVCQRYGADGLDFIGNFSTARMTDETLREDAIVKLMVDHGDAVLMDLTGYEYTGTMIVRAEGTYTAVIAEKQLVMSAEDAQSIKIAKILLGDE